MKQAYYHRHRVMMNSGHKCDKIFIFCLYLCCRRRSNYQEGEGWDPIIRFNTATFFFTCSRPGSGFPMQYVMFFFPCVQLFEWKGNCWLFWYWWNHWNWPSLFKLYIHKPFYENFFSAMLIYSMEIVFMIHYLSH